MIKTSTKNFSSESSKTLSEEQLLKYEMNFIKSLKPQLDQLFRDAPKDTINKILAYAKFQKT